LEFECRDWTYLEQHDPVPYIILGVSIIIGFTILAVILGRKKR